MKKKIKHFVYNDEASWVAIKYDTDLHHYYHELKQRMKGNKAIIRVAKKLATKVRYNLLELHTKAYALIFSI